LEKLTAWILGFEFGEFLDLEALTALKFLQLNTSSQVCGLAEYDFRNQFCGNRNSDFYLFGGGTPQIPNTIILININPRLESPLLNLKLRNLAVAEHVSTWIFGFISNTNFSFEHKLYNLNTVSTMLSGKESLLIIAKRMPENIDRYSSCYLVSENYSLLGAREVFGRMPLSKSEMRIACGSPEYKLLEDVAFRFNTMLLHHVDAEKQQNYGKLTRLLLPTKFYLEKFGSYLTESGYFFSTITNIFGYGISGTKED